WPPLPPTPPRFPYTTLFRSGVELSSDTDSEVAAHLLAREMDSGRHAGDLVASCRAVLARLEGAFTLVFSHADHPDTRVNAPSRRDRKSTRLNSSHVSISYAV